MGLLLLVDLYHRSRDLVAHYTDKGILPTDVFFEYYSYLPYKLSLHALSGSAVYQGGLFLVAGLFALSLTLGFYTRFSAVISWLFLISLQDRNIMILYGGDIYIRVLLFWGLFLPLGEHFSVDRMLKKDEEPPLNVFSSASVAYLLQVCIVYWAAAAFKWNPDWFSGTAVTYALKIDQFATPLGLWLRELTWLHPVLTYITLYVELLGPFLAFMPFCFGPLRTLAVVIFSLMHVGFGLSLTLGLFSFIGITAWIPFLPTWFWKKWGFKDHGPVESSPFWENMTVGFLCVYVIFFNIHTINPNIRPPLFGKDWQSLANILHINQKWNMFSRPLRDDGWYVVQGQTLSGKNVDLFQSKNQLDWTKPSLVSHTYKNDRWRKFMMNIWWNNNKRYRQHFARYLTNDWNEKHAGFDKVQHVNVFFVLERTGDNLQSEIPQRVLIERFSVSSNSLYPFR